MVSASPRAPRTAPGETQAVLSILVPAYNEADGIGQTLSLLDQVMDETQIPYEIIVIDDGSEDATAERAESCGVRLIRQPQNGGYGLALKTALHHARYEWCAIIDADGSYDVGCMPDLLMHIPDYDMVVGARDRFYDSLPKRIGRFFLLKTVEYATRRKIPDVNSGMRVFRKDIALAHENRISSGFSFTTTLTLNMMLEDHFVRYVPIEYQRRVGKSKVKIGIDTIRVARIVIQALLYYDPFKIFLPLCVLGLLAGTLLGFVVHTYHPVLGWLFFGVSILTTLVLGAMGMLAEAVRLHRVTQVVGRRPE
jgi:glycosyltransferase involved in cell wall biosynthesis